MSTDAVVLEGNLSIYCEDLRGCEIWVPELDERDLGKALRDLLPATNGPGYGRVRISVQVIA